MTVRPEKGKSKKVNQSVQYDLKTKPYSLDMPCETTETDMTDLRTTLLATLFAFSATQALAGPAMIDLPRLDFPTAHQTSSTTPDSTLPPALLPRNR